MRKVYAIMALGITALFVMLYYKNTFSYGSKTKLWRLVKSLVDCTVIVLSALYLPAILVGLCVKWLIRPVVRPGIQVVLAIVLGIAFGAVSGIALEVVCVFSVFAVDLLTGEKGVYGWWKETIPETFLPSLSGPQLVVSQSQ
jgi:hypothetical protein